MAGITGAPIWGGVKETGEPLPRGFRVTSEPLLGGCKRVKGDRNPPDAVEFREDAKSAGVDCRACWSRGLAVASKGFSIGGGTKSVEMILFFGRTTSGRKTMSCSSMGSKDESSSLLLVKLNLLTGSRATKAGTIGVGGAVSVV